MPGRRPEILTRPRIKPASAISCVNGEISSRITRMSARHIYFYPIASHCLSLSEGYCPSPESIAFRNIRSPSFRPAVIFRYVKPTNTAGTCPINEWTTTGGVGRTRRNRFRIFKRVFVYRSISSPSPLHPNPARTFFLFFFSDNFVRLSERRRRPIYAPVCYAFT